MKYSFEGFLLLLGLFILAGCIALPGITTPTVALAMTPTYVVRATAMEAREEGRLMMVDQCLRVVGGTGEGDLLVWSDNWEVSVQGNQVHIMDNGMVTGQRKEYDFSLGDDIVLGGGSHSGPLTASWYRVSSPSCPGPYFEVSGIDDTYYLIHKKN